MTKNALMERCQKFRRTPPHFDKIQKNSYFFSWNLPLDLLSVNLSFFTLIVKLSWVSNCFMIRSSEAGSGHNEGRGRGAQNVNWWRSTTSDCPTVSLRLLHHHHHHHHQYHQYNPHQPHPSLNIDNVGICPRVEKDKICKVNFENFHFHFHY